MHNKNYLNSKINKYRIIIKNDISTSGRIIRKKNYERVKDKPFTIEEKILNLPIYPNLNKVTKKPSRC